MSVKITELPAASDITANDHIPFTDQETLTTKRITFSNFKGSFVDQDTWTPEISFTTPGNLAVTYTIQTGYYYKIDRLVFLQFEILTTTFTHTTASGLLVITGLPFSFAFTTKAVGVLTFQGITMASYTQFSLVGISGQSVLNIYASGSGQSQNGVAATDMPSGGTVILTGTIMMLTV
jgi:hypothetical protein